MKTSNALFPKVRTEVLGILFLGTGTELHVREIVRRSGLNLRTVQRELIDLAEARIIVSRREGNRQYFKANPEHPLYADLKSIVLKIVGPSRPGRQTIKKSLGNLASGQCADAHLEHPIYVGLKSIVQKLTAAKSILERGLGD